MLNFPVIICSLKSRLSAKKNQSFVKWAKSYELISDSMSRWQNSAMWHMCALPYFDMCIPNWYKINWWMDWFILMSLKV